MESDVQRTLSEALDLVDISRSKLYQDATDGTISTEKKKQGKKVVDVAELESVYGQFRNPVVDNKASENGKSRTHRIVQWTTSIV